MASIGTISSGVDEGIAHGLGLGPYISGPDSKPKPKNPARPVLIWDFTAEGRAQKLSIEYLNPLLSPLMKKIGICF